MESSFAVVAEPNRRAILSLLLSSERSVGEIERERRRPCLHVHGSANVRRREGAERWRQDDLPLGMEKRRRQSGCRCAIGSLCGSGGPHAHESQPWRAASRSARSENLRGFVGYRTNRRRCRFYCAISIFSSISRSNPLLPRQLQPSFQTRSAARQFAFPGRMARPKERRRNMYFTRMALSSGIRLKKTGRPRPQPRVVTPRRRKNLRNRITRP